MRYALCLIAALAFCGCSNKVSGFGGDEQGGPGGPSGSEGADDDEPLVEGRAVRATYGSTELTAGSTTALPLGTTRVNGFTPRHRVTIKNIGTASLDLEAAAVSGFSASLPATLASGETTTMALEMPPAVVGELAGTIELVTSAGTYRFALDGKVLRGTGVPVNPAWDTAPWRLWFEDATPFSFPPPSGNTPVTYAPTPPEQRRFPAPSALTATYPSATSFVTTEVAPSTPSAAGWWDDGAASLDGAHTGPGVEWWSTVPGSPNYLPLSGQFIGIGHGYASFNDRMEAGINYTSTSLSHHGHQLIRNWFSQQQTEAQWMFVNTVRGTPAVWSYQERDATHTNDNFDGLFGSNYISLGQSGSEVLGMTKMMFAGGYMPRNVKETLKRNGLYAPVIFTLFREALPYVNADGSPVPYESEMIQRPVYLSRGDYNEVSWGQYNLVYHQYDEELHFYRMTRNAMKLTTPPPVASMELVSVKTVGGDVWDPGDARYKTRGRTTMTFWPDRDESIEIVVDLGGSVDLNGGDCDFSATAVYPNRDVFEIERIGETALFRIRATPDASLPLGRNSILLQAHARGLRSNPVFVNVYWPQVDQSDVGYMYYENVPGGGYSTSDPKTRVFWNARPVITTSVGADTLAGAVGVASTFTVTCADPEGYPTRLYRSASDAGTMNGDTYTFTPSASGNYPVALICSDGTGGVGSTRITIQVP